MKKFIALLIIGFIFIGIGCGLMLYQYSREGIDLKPLADFIHNVFRYDITIEDGRIEIKHNR